MPTAPGALEVMAQMPYLVCVSAPFGVINEDPKHDIWLWPLVTLNRDEVIGQVRGGDLRHSTSKHRACKCGQRMRPTVQPAAHLKESVRRWITRVGPARKREP